MSELEVKNDTATAEICANRCYQDGCTGARYDPETMECALGYGDHQYCSDDQQYDRFRTNETIWIHCITCKEPLPDDRQFELLVDESEETTKFPEGVLPRRGPLASSVPLDFTTLSSVESTEEVSGESTTHETASTTVEGLFTQLDAQSTSQPPATPITENAVISSEEGTFIPTDETGELSTVAEHSSSSYSQSETASETTELPERAGSGTAFETTTSTEGVTNRVVDAVSSSDVIDTSILDAAVESEGTTLPAVKIESFAKEISSTESSYPAEEDLATEDHILVFTKTTTFPDRSASEGEMSKEEKTPEASIYGNEPEPPLASAGGRILEATAELPENEAGEAKKMASPSTIQSTQEVQSASRTATSTVGFEAEAFTADIESESTTPNQPAVITISADFVKSSTTTASSAEKLETSSTMKLATSNESLERLRTNIVGSTKEPAGLSSLSSTTSSTYDSSEEKKRSSKLPASVSAVESADEAEPEWPDHDKEDENTSFIVQSINDENSEQSEGTTTAARIINAGEVIVDLGVAITTIKPHEFSAKQGTQETREVFVSTSTLGESIDETVTKAAKYDGSKISGELLARVATSSEQTVNSTETAAEVANENGVSSTAEEKVASLSASSDIASTSTVATSFTDTTGGGEVHSSTVDFATTGSEYELKSASQEENVEKVQSTSLKDGQYTLSTVAGDVAASFTESSKLSYFKSTSEKTRTLADESDMVSKDHLPVEGSTAIFTDGKTTTATDVDSKTEEKLESEGKVRTGEDNEMSTTLEHRKMIEATTVTEQPRYETSSLEPDGLAFVTGKPEGKEGEETRSKIAPTVTSFESVLPADERVTSEVTDEKVGVSSVTSDRQVATVMNVEEVPKTTNALNDVSTSENTEEGDQTDHTREPVSHKLADESADEAMKVSSTQKATDGLTTTPLSIEAAFIPDFLKKIQKTINSEGRDETSQSTQLIKDFNIDASNAHMRKVDESNTQSRATEELTTSAEPPLQAVSDLVDALSQNTKLEEILGLTSAATPHEEPSTSSKIIDENFSIDESVTEREKEIAIPISHIDITNLESTQSRSVPLANQPFIYEGTAVGCPGRLEFQRMSVTALPKLNVTNDVPARTPADCARKCFETEGCSLAGYIPSPTGDPTNGVCVLTSDDEVCLQTKKFVPQHASLSPFVLSCIKCFRKFIVLFQINFLLYRSFNENIC
uniref:Apple domain-containing protein n=1 Tax=Parascaris univalens TaxID=6257 RepID=A0A914ZKG1_PARUN